MKRQPTEGEKIFATHISEKGLVSKIFKELIQLNSEIITQLKVDKGPKEIFFLKKTYKQRYLKRCSA